MQSGGTSTSAERTMSSYVSTRAYHRQGLCTWQSPHHMNQPVHTQSQTWDTRVQFVASFVCQVQLAMFAFSQKASSSSYWRWHSVLSLSQLMKNWTTIILCCCRVIYLKSLFVIFTIDIQLWNLIYHGCCVLWSHMTDFSNVGSWSSFGTGFPNNALWTVIFLISEWLWQNKNYRVNAFSEAVLQLVLIVQVDDSSTHKNYCYTEPIAAVADKEPDS